MPALGEATVEVRATLDKLDSDLSAAKGKIGSALGGLERGLQSVGNIALGGAVAGIAAVAAGLGLAISEAMGAQQIMAQTEAVIKSTGGAAGMTAEQVGELATALSTQSRFSDDAIQSAENLLLTFTNIGAETFPMATQAMVDMAAAMGTDVKSGAIQLGKALNDPVAGISALTRVGVTFTDEQKKVIKALVATGDVAGAQAVILAELNKEFGGSAAAAAETFAGKLDVLKNKLLNVAEGLGMVLLPIMTTVFDHVAAVVLPIIDDLAAALGNFFEGLASGEDPAGDFANLAWEISTALGATKEEAAAVFASTRELVDGLIEFGAKVGEVIAAVTPYIAMAAEWLASNIKLQDVLITLGIAIASVVIPAIIAAVAAAAPLVLAFLAVMAVVVLLRTAWEQNWGGIQEKTAAVVGWLTATISKALADIQAWWSENGDAILAKATAIWDGVREAVAAGITAAREIVANIVTAIRDLWSANSDAILAKAVEIWNAISDAISTAITAVRENITNVANGIRDYWAEHGAEILAKSAETWAGIQAAVLENITKTKETITSVAGEIQVFWAEHHDELLATTISKLEEIKQNVSQALAGIQTWWDEHGANVMVIVKFLWDLIVATIQAALIIIGVIVAGALLAIQWIWANWGDTIIQIVEGMGERLGFLIDGIAALIKGDWEGLGTAILGFWRSTWEGIGLVLTNAFTILGGIMNTSKTMMLGKVSELVEGMKSFFTDTDWGAVGRSMIDGIVNGLRNAAGVLLDAARNAARAAFDAAMNAIQGHSPSKLFMDVGESMMQGMAKGILRNTDLTKAALSGALMPAMGLVGEDGGADRSIHYSSVTTVNTSRDPMRVLRASRHLDKLGSMA